MKPGATPGILDEEEMLDVQLMFGVDEEQVRRDHVISHALAALGGIDDSRLVFFGGTALSRTYLPNLRLSEDIDLIALAVRAEVAAEVQQYLESGLKRTFRTPTFTPDIASTGHSDPSVMDVGDVRIQIQLLSSEGYPAWPTEVRSLTQRYSDAPLARMRVLTAPAFAAAKLSAWVDRGAPRDLYDMWALARLGMIDEEAKRLFAKYGPITSSTRVPFSNLPTAAGWGTALNHQCIPQVDPTEAAEVVSAAWR
ncbi:hypothetical protein FM104_01135 [Microbacterium esteraromaticum]|uniref:Nucleotidyl transferase AbiEii/AbiGii toxin family protein n=1 Tax=Microbacterium esteraromaticum TaxID=57043 RepID=A0A1R4IAR1_9MICO|nr:nucleotidyl transferase AbiEii/AbiGii toxin family protein [Microbacterium esteraromaticum]SJN16925.1 hypothetical protein FM104_01135 [Microbacterium esteraromaticum]